MQFCRLESEGIEVEHCLSHPIPNLRLRKSRSGWNAGEIGVGDADAPVDVLLRVAGARPAPPAGGRSGPDPRRAFPLRRAISALRSGRLLPRGQSSPNRRQSSPARGRSLPLRGQCLPRRGTLSPRKRSFPLHRTGFSERRKGFSTRRKCFSPHRRGFSPRRRSFSMRRKRVSGGRQGSSGKGCRHGPLH